MKIKNFVMQFFIALGIVAAMMWAIPVQAQENNRIESRVSQQAVIITRYDVKKDHQKQLRIALRNYVVLASSRRSNIMVEAYAEQDSPTVFWVIERWRSYQSYQKMHRTVRFKTLESFAKSALMKPAYAISVTDLEPMPLHDWNKTTASSDKPLTIMLFVDAKPGTEDNFKDVYHMAMPKFRSEPGVVNYQLSQFKDDKTRFVTYEKFRNEDAFQYHLNFPPIQPVIDYLNTSIRKQPFQLGLHKLKEI